MHKKTLSVLISNLLFVTCVSQATAGENHSHDHSKAKPTAHQHTEEHTHGAVAEHQHQDQHKHNATAEHQHEDGHSHSAETDHQHEDDHSHGAEHEDKHDHSTETEHPHEAKDGHAHGDTDEHGHEEEGVVHLTPKQQAMIGLQTTPLKAVLLAESQKVPGEVVSNRYHSSLVSPQADVRVVERYVMLGDHVEQGQPLVMLFSDELADRFSDLKNNAKEWEIVRKLGKSLAGKNRYSQAQTNYQQSLTKVAAFGLSNKEIEAQLKADSQHPLGQFVLKAPHAGVIQQDDFLIGQHISSNEPLFMLVNETSVWVEAQLPANLAVKLSKGTQIDLTVGADAYQGRLLQLAHSLNEATRTRMARISVNNKAHQLHPGQFAQVRMPLAQESWQLFLPEAAFTRTPDGDWGIFLEQAPGEYKLQEVQIRHETSDGRIIDGLKEGSLVVTSGTFFLASEQAKAGFDIHNH